ncbi:polysaccharide deacetylase family protein [Candidatus Omnitrophota bacterium]
MLTLDVHPFDKVENYVIEALDELNELGIKATFFVTASIFKGNRKIAREIISGGHQIAMHGLYHNAQEFNQFPPERYDKVSLSFQRKFIDQATKILEDAAGHKISCFRSPCFSISGGTICALEECGYLADFSVNSQRLDLLSSNPFACNHLLAPRLPYHPNYSNPYRRGNSNIWEIPLSSFIVPFAIMTLMTFRLKLTKLFFKTLHKETKATNKPIVYMMHPEEFSPKSENVCAINLKSLGLKDFLPFGSEGIVARRMFRMTDPDKIYCSNRALLRYIQSHKDVSFVTADEYIKHWLNSS